MMIPVRDPWSKNPRVFLNTLDSMSVSTRPIPQRPLSANHLSRPALEQRGSSLPPGCTGPCHRQCLAEARPIRALPHPVPRRRLHTRILRVARAQVPLPALPSRQGPLALREQRGCDGAHHRGAFRARERGAYGGACFVQPSCDSQLLPRLHRRRQDSICPEPLRRGTRHVG